MIDISKLKKELILSMKKLAYLKYPNIPILINTPIMKKDFLYLVLFSNTLYSEKFKIILIKITIIPIISVKFI